MLAVGEQMSKSAVEITSFEDTLLEKAIIDSVAQEAVQDLAGDVLALRGETVLLIPEFPKEDSEHAENS
jgi:hypothetical protein